MTDNHHVNPLFAASAPSRRAAPSAAKIGGYGGMALDANAVVNAFSQSITGHITSTLDGDTQTIPDPAKAEAAKQGA